MTYGSSSLPVLEHGSSATARWLRARRLRFAIWAAVAEGALVLFGAIPRWPALGVAALVLVAYFTVGRSLRSYTARQVAWVAAASQALVFCVPLLLIVVSGLAFAALAVLAVAALVVLFLRR